MRQALSVLLNSTAFLALATAPSLAQSTMNQPGVQTQQQTTGQQFQQQNLTAAGFVRQAAVGNMFEIQSSQLALDRSRNEAIQNFAQEMIDDHQNLGQTLRSVATNVAIPTQLDQRHLQMLNQLQQATGNGFDRQFLRMQVRAHRQAIALYQRFTEQVGQNQVGGFQQTNQQLQQFAQETLPVLREHLQTAQQLRQQIRQGASGVAAGDTTQRMAQTGQLGDGRTLTIQQPPPRVVVRRQSPDVSVQQAQPRIIIRQEPPTVTIQQPPPEVTVQMPRPDVNVATQQPQVSVAVPRPQVRFADQDLAPRVTMQRSGAPEVQIQRAQPQIDYQRVGEPTVVYQRGNQQPTVRIQSAAGGDAERQNLTGNQQDTAAQQLQQGLTGEQTATDQQNVADQQNTTGRLRTVQPAGDQTQVQTGVADQQSTWIRDASRLSVDDTDQAEAATTGSATAAVQTMPLTVSRLTDMDIYNARGQNLGSIDDVITDRQTNRTYVVLAHGGFLGMFQDEVALPLDRLRYRGNRLVVSGLTSQEISQMPDWQNQVRNHVSLDDAQSVQLRR